MVTPTGTTLEGLGSNAAAPAADGLQYQVLCKKHPEYDAGYWKRLRAFYSGGKKLLQDVSLLAEVFPQHRNEDQRLYAERIKRAFYLPYAAEIVDHLISSLTAAPVQITMDDETEKKDVPDELPEFWAEFVKDCSPPGGEKATYAQLMRDQLLTALVVKTAWTKVDMPRTAGSFGSRSEQEKAGALDVYAVPVDAECVFDWEEDDNRELLWAVIHTQTQRRESIRATRNRITETWMVWDRNGWERYEITYPEDKPPNPETMVPRMDGAVHPFKGKVPLVRLMLPDGLHAMEKLESIAKEHFNKRSALGWGETQALLPELYEFQAPTMALAGVPPGAQDPNRATNQNRGIGFVQLRSEKDRAEYVGPDPAPFQHVMMSCDGLRDEMHRVTHRMALTVGNSQAALGRSGESKEMDRVAESIVLTALGERLREHAEHVVQMAARGRSEEDLVEKVHATGCDKFDQRDVGSAITEATELSTVSIPSPTFWRIYYYQLCKAILGPNATREDLDQIKEELVRNVPEEMPATPEGDPMVEEAPEEPELDEEGNPIPPPTSTLPPKKTPKIRSGPTTMFSSKREGVR